MNQCTNKILTALAAAVTLTCSLSGCRTPFVNPAITADQEKTIGDWAAAQIQSESVGPIDPAIPQVVDQIAIRLDQSIPSMAPPRVLVSDSDAYAVASLPGGWVVISARTVKLLQSDPDALAGVLAHEFAHVEHDDALREMIGALGPNTMVNMSSQGKYTETSNVAVQLMNFRHNMDDEYRADSEGVRIAAAAGYDPHGILTAIAMLRSVTPASDAQWLQVHPLTTYRFKLLAADIEPYAQSQNTK